MRSGSNRSRPPIRSATPMNLIGLPVTWRTDRAAPATSVAIELGQDDAGQRQTFGEGRAVLTASWPSMLSTTNSVSIGLSAA